VWAHLLPSTASQERGEARSSCTFRALPSNSRWPRRIVAIPPTFRSPRRRPSQFDPYPRSPPHSCTSETPPGDSGGRSAPAGPGDHPHRSPGHEGGTEDSRGTLAGRRPEAQHRRVIPNSRVPCPQEPRGRMGLRCLRGDSHPIPDAAKSPGWSFAPPVGGTIPEEDPMATIVKYTDQQPACNRYPDRIVSPSRRAPAVSLTWRRSGAPAGRAVVVLLPALPALRVHCAGHPARDAGSDTGGLAAGRPSPPSSCGRPRGVRKPRSGPSNSPVRSAATGAPSGCGLACSLMGALFGEARGR